MYFALYWLDGFTLYGGLYGKDILSLLLAAKFTPVSILPRVEFFTFSSKTATRAAARDTARGVSSANVVDLASS